MSQKKPFDPNRRTALARKMSAGRFRMWGTYLTKSGAQREAAKLRSNYHYAGVDYKNPNVRVVEISNKKGHPYPWAVYVRPAKGGAWR